MEKGLDNAKGWDAGGVNLEVCEVLPCPVVLYDRQGRISFLNGQGRLFFQSETPKTLNDLFLPSPLFFPSSSESVREGEATVLRRGEPFRKLPVQVVLLPGRDLICCTFSLPDPNEERRRRWEESERRLRPLLESVNAFFWQMEEKQGQRWEYTLFTEGVKTITGLSSDELLSGKGSLVETVFEEDWAALEYAFLGAMQGERREVEYRLQRTDGSLVWVKELWIPVLEGERVIRIDGLCLDITEEKRREDDLKSLRAAVDQMEEGVALIDKEGRILYANPCYADFVDRSVEELQGRKILDFPLSEEVLSSLDEIRQALRQGKTWRGRYTGLREGGLPREEEGAVSPVRGVNGEVASYVVTRQDITWKRDLEVHAERSRRFEEVSLLAAGLAHDFNNILGGILGYTEWFRKRADPESREYHVLEEMERAGGRAARLVSDLLGLAREGKMEVKPIELNSLVLEILGKLPWKGFPKVLLDQSLEKDLPLVEGDRRQISQVLYNLLLNALEAFSEKGGTLKVRTRSVKLEEEGIPAMKGQGISLSVADNGPGLSEGIRRHLFDPFFTTKVDGRHLGLGLPTAMGIVQNHKGHLRFRDNPGGGALFELFFLSLTESSQESAKDLCEAPFRGVEKESKVLVIDDEELVRDFLDDLLQEAGYQTLLAANGKEGLDLFLDQGGQIGAVLLDIKMPVMDGKETFRELHARDPRLPVFLISGYAQNGEVQELLDKGALGFIHKPFRIEEVLTKIGGSHCQANLCSS